MTERKGILLIRYRMYPPPTATPSSVYIDFAIDIFGVICIQTMRDVSIASRNGQAATHCPHGVNGGSIKSP